MLKLRYILSPFYHLWFYLLVLITTVVLSPFLLVSTIKESWYPQFYKVARIWSTIILYGMGCFPDIKQKQAYTYKKSFMFVANHRSMLDIMLMYYSVSTPFVFVGKKELARIPIFGFFYKRTCILVDRQNMRSKGAVMKEANKRIESGLSICIFPEGGIPDDTSVELDRFKDGAFRLAIEHRIPIAPLVFHDNGRHFPYSVFGGYPGRLRVDKLPIIDTNGTTVEDKFKLRDSIREQILETLENAKK